ncbi:hypothetical protein P7C71_g4489, partial [Lecanoromycetidae sp. Uapishka_2]
MKLLIPAFTLLTTAIALPYTNPIFTNTTRSFKLKSHVLTPPNPAFECLYLEPYHIYPPFNYAVLSPKTTEDPGIVGTLNGTVAQLANDEGNLIFDSAVEEPPYGFVIASINSTYNPVEILPGNGTQGIFINQGVIKYNNPISGGFYGKCLSLGPQQGCCI